MLLPEVVPLPTASLDYAVEQINRIRNDLAGVSNGEAPAVLLAYQRWSTGASQFLGHMFDHDSLEQLVLTKRYWLLTSMLAKPDNGPLIHDLVGAERTDRERHLDAIVKQIDDARRRWVSTQASPLVADTNVYLHYEAYFDEVDWRAVTGMGEMRLLVPMTVVRELDKAKRGPQNKFVSDTNRESTRTRARVTTRRLRKMFDEPTSISRLRAGLEVELLLDSPKHRAISDPDSEIVDRAVAAQTLIGRRVSVLTNDAGMQFSARSAGLGVILLPDPPEAGEGT